ncbi:hypothetical protein G6F68_015004 [Rhizopus microsporus]|nr:hypothetical protein G6F68_015004 [Rhizopus microsporus]
MRQGHRQARRCRQALQQGFDAHEAQQQVALALRLPVAEVETRAEVLALALQHDQPGTLRLGLVQRRDQRLPQFGRQRVHLLGACERQHMPRALLVDMQNAAHAVAPFLTPRKAPSTSSLCSPSAGGRKRSAVV